MMMKRRSRTRKGHEAQASFNVLLDVRTINRECRAEREYSGCQKVLVSLGQIPT
jgi:hypothetical protein